ncbi:MAG: cysteine peptidase family C39 domain-containing protein [Lentimicrobiaceae bacterium]|nr:cysteine peptidase family C39 domain-containing protein [Lentimicrobiaceae bacterium]
MKSVVESSHCFLTKLGIKHTRHYLSKTLQSHPFYPSLAAVRDLFTHYQIENEALKVSYETLLTLQTPFMAHLTTNGGIFVVVKQVTESEVWFYKEENQLKSITKEDFIKIWDQVVFLANPCALSSEPHYETHQRKERIENVRIPVLIGVLIFSFLSFVFLKPSIASLMPLFFAKTTGLFFAILLVKQELGFSSPIADKLCTLSKSAGCNEVLHSKASKLFGNIFLSDVGLIWFIATSLYLIFSSISAALPALILLGWCAAGSVPMILFSIGYQLFVIKKYCPLCLGVMFMLVCEALLLPLFYGFRFQRPPIEEIWLLFTLLGLSSIIWFAWKQLTLQNNKLKYTETAYLHLKSNPHVIETQLLESDEIELALLPQPIHLTNSQSNLMLTEIINLYCQPCKVSFEKIKYLLNLPSEEGIDVQLLLLSNTDHPEHQMTQTALHFVAFAEQQPADLIKEALFDWFNLLDYRLWSKKYPATIAPHHLTQLKSHACWFRENRLEGTPVAFLNKKKIPYTVDLNDLQYFL